MRNNSNVRIISLIGVAVAAVASVMAAQGNFVISEIGVVIMAICGLTLAALRCGFCKATGFWSVLLDQRFMYLFYFGKRCPKCNVERL